MKLARCRPRVPGELSLMEVESTKFQPVCVSHSIRSDFVMPRTTALQAPPSMGFSRQEYWSGLPFPSPGNLPDPGIESGSPALQADALPFEPPGKPRGKPN